MSYIYSRALVEEFLPASCSDTDAFVPSSTNPTPKPCLWHDKTMAPSRLSRFGMTCEPFEANRGEELLMSFVADFRAKTSAQPEAAPESTAHDPDSGAKWPASSVRYDPATSSWKTAHCLWDEDLPWSSVTLPKWGMTRNGHVYRHPTAERPISGTVSGLWPTPLASNHTGAGHGPNKTGSPNLQTVVAMWPTPTVCGNHNRKGLSASSGDGLATIVKQRTWPTATATASKGWSKNHRRANSDDRLDYTVERENFQPGQQTPPMRLNPDWVEWLMGWPIGHTDLKPLATDRYHEWRQQHLPCYQENKEAA
jgi:hypothetical protein